jgi:hypothetical protein
MNRDFDPAVGRYVESDPIGLNGGVNTYSYVRSKPTAATDSTGLLEQCRSGLDLLKGAAVGPFHHEFQCWKNADGTTTCRGYGRDPSSSVIDAIIRKVKGKILRDDENKIAATASCGIDDNNKCMDDCASKEWQKLEKNIPAYGLIQGADCQTVNQIILRKCSVQCHVPPPASPLVPEPGDPDFPDQGL